MEMRDAERSEVRFDRRVEFRRGWIPWALQLLASPDQDEAPREGWRERMHTTVLRKNPLTVARCSLA